MYADCSRLCLHTTRLFFPQPERFLSAAISARKLVKQYRKVRALNEISLEIPRGSIFGLVGSNGAGKTTLMSISSGLIKPDGGECNILGDGNFNPKRHAGRISILPQDSVPPRYARVDHMLHYYALLQGLSPHEARDAIREVLCWVNLEDRLTDPVRSLSHGMLRRFTVAQAFLGNPEIVLLDEPMSGLDPLEVNSLRELIRSRRGKQTIVISSHILHELQHICDEAAFIERGELVRQDTMQGITRLGEQINIRIKGTPPLEAIQQAIAPHHAEFDEQQGLIHIHLDNESSNAHVGSINEIVLRALLDARCEVLELLRGSNLESEYLKQHGEA